MSDATHAEQERILANQALLLSNQDAIRSCLLYTSRCV